MNPLVERKGFKIESTLPQKKKTKEKKSKSKPVEHVQIIDDDAPIPWSTTTTATTTKTAAESVPIIPDEIISADDAPVIVGKICFF